MSPAFARRRDALAALAGHDSLHERERAEILAELDRPAPDLDSALDCLHRAQRLLRLHAARLEHSPAAAADLARAGPLWRDFRAPPVADALQEALADKLYNVTDPARAHAVIKAQDMSRAVVPKLIARLQADGAVFDFQIEEPHVTAALLAHATPEGVAALAAHDVAEMAPATSAMMVYTPLPPGRAPTLPADSQKAYARARQPLEQRYRSGELFYTLTKIPAEADARLEGLAYRDYVDLFFQMVDQPWAEIDRAHRHLIAQLDAAAHLRFTNADGTDIGMDIAGFTFCNSLIAKNIPGSEVFSAPRLDSVQGRLVARGRFTHGLAGGEIIEDIRLDFAGGEVVDMAAAGGEAVLARILDTDEGARRVGEVGIGTNPQLQRHVLNSLLVEKIGGSFHLALGNAYSMTRYQGQPVQVDNGNRSGLHWDITALLHGREGRIELDGAPIMDHGDFLDPELAVLNQGWAALPAARRPGWWGRGVDPHGRRLKETG